jgi:hypothetical protein
MDKENVPTEYYSAFKKQLNIVTCDMNEPGSIRINQINEV